MQHSQAKDNMPHQHDDGHLTFTSPLEFPIHIIFLYDMEETHFSHKIK